MGIFFTLEVRNWTFEELMFAARFVDSNHGNFSCSMMIIPVSCFKNLIVDSVGSLLFPADDPFFTAKQLRVEATHLNRLTSVHILVAI